MRTVLVVAYYFPPIATIGSMRPLAFCRHLQASGWRPRVLAADPNAPSPPLPVDAELAARIPPGTIVDRVDQRDPVRMMLAIRDRLRRRRSTVAGVPSANATRPASTRPARRLADLLLTHLFQVPDAQRAWHRAAVKAGRRGERPDLVYATGGPWTALLVGQSLARRFGVPFVADFRDPWTRNPFRAQHPTVWRRNRRLERKICHAAARIVVNTSPLRERFASDYPEIADRFVTISNGFDRADDERVERADQEAHATDAIELCHFGTVYGKRTPLGLLTALDRLHANGAPGSSALRVRFVGPWELDESDPASRLAQRLEALGVVQREAPVAHRECLALMRRARMLLVLQPDSPLQVPGKLFECVASRRPLVVIGGDGATADLVQRHRLGRCTANDPGAIEHLLLDLAAGARPQALPPDAAEAFNYRNLTRQLADVFDAVTRPSESLAA